MIETDHLDDGRTAARRKAVKSVLATLDPHDVWEVRKEAKLTMPAAPALVTWEEVIRLLGVEDVYQQQVELELGKLEASGGS